jgi:hypothetical protein
MRELAGSIVPRPSLVTGPIHPGTVYRTRHVFSPVLLLSIQERRDSKKYRREKSYSLHLIFLSGMRNVSVK